MRDADRTEKQRWYSGLLFVARQRGYQPGWVSHTYRQKFGVWPRNMAETAREPDQDVKNYVTFMNIRRARSKRRAA